MLKKIIFTGALITCFTCNAYADNLSDTIWEIKFHQQQLESRVTELDGKVSNLETKIKLMKDALRKSGVDMGLSIFD